MAWNRTWKTSGRQLSEQVVVSVAVDIEARQGPGILVSGDLPINYFTSCDPHRDIFTFSYWQIFWHSI